MRHADLPHIAPYLSALMMIFSVFVLLRGHNEPGGGFIGGLIAASAFAIYGIACGVAPARRALRFPSRWRSPAPALLMSVLAGLALDLLRRAVPDRALGAADPSASSFELSTLLFFDIGVYLVVLGAITSIALALEERDDD